jgi:hypothetical protein
VVAYYQQIGRAARELDDAVVVLLAGVEDDEIIDFFIRQAFPGADVLTDVLNAIEDSEEGLSALGLEARSTRRIRRSRRRCISSKYRAPKTPDLGQFLTQCKPGLHSHANSRCRKPAPGWLSAAPTQGLRLADTSRDTASAVYSSGNVSRMNQFDVSPQSTRRSIPVMPDASSEARKRNAAATSPVFTSRRIGTRAKLPLR